MGVRVVGVRLMRVVRVVRVVRVLVMGGMTVQKQPAFPSSPSCFSSRRLRETPFLCDSWRL